MVLFPYAVYYNKACTEKISENRWFCRKIFCFRPKNRKFFCFLAKTLHSPSESKLTFPYGTGEKRGINSAPKATKYTRHNPVMRAFKR